MRGEWMAARRLRELPDGSKRNAAGRGRKRILRVHTAGRRRARVIVHEESDGARNRAGANVVGRDDKLIFPLASGNPGTINSGAIPGIRERIDPGKDVGHLPRCHAPTLFLIEKNDCAAGKSFACGGICSGLSILHSAGGRVGRGIQLAFETPIKKHQIGRASCRVRV